MTESPRNIDQLQAELEDARWQLRIEAALDRLRTAVSKMTLSSELLDIVTIMSEEFSGLGLETVQISNCRLMPGGYTVSATKVGGDRLQFEYNWPFDGNPIEKGIRAWLASDDPLVVFEYSPELGTEHMEFIKTRTDYFELDPDAQGETKSRVETDGCFMIFARTASGAITNITWDAPSQKSLDVLEKFAGAFDLAYARFEDLNKAESQTRAAQIGLAVERVRAKALAMHNPEDILEVVIALREEIRGLGLKGVSAATIFLEQPNGHYRVWDISIVEDTQRDNPFSIDMVFDPSAVDSDMYFQEILKTKEDYFVRELETEDLYLIEKWVRQFDPGNADIYLEYLESCQNSRQWIPSVPLEKGRLCVDFLEPPPEEMKTILPQMAAAFDLAYTRFEDLQRAEAQTREAQIEAALERVRARSMAMQSPEDLEAVTLVFVDQLTGLGMPVHWAGMALHDPVDDTWTLRLGYSKLYDVERLRGKVFTIPLPPRADDPTIEAPDDGVVVKQTHISKEEHPAWMQKYAIVYETTGQDPAEVALMYPDGFYRIDSFISHGLFGGGAAEPFSDEQLGIQDRFAREFERTYQRFLDLKKAEAQAREAQIEAALERVRAQAMSMQTSEDIGHTALFLFNEILELCSSVLRVGLWIMSGPDEMEGWLAGSDHKGNVDIVKGTVINRGDRPEMDLMMNSWVSGKSCSFLESDSFLRWAREVVYGDVDQNIVRVESTTEQHLTTFIHKNGLLNVAAGAGLSPETGEGAIIQRFAGVFDLAYQRYHDLAQAESDYKALLAEKALTEETLTVLQATQAQLVEQEKLASLGALTAGIAHEIKNPLNFVNNFAEVSAEMSQEIIDALASGDLDEARDIAGELATNSDQIAKHGKRADSIVRSMMQHARGGASEMETIELNTYLEEYINLAWHGMRARDDDFSAEIKREFDAAVGSIAAMPQELGRVILNLLNNAFDAIRETENATVMVATRALASNVEISISDNGPGIPPDIREKIFEPFFTTKATGEGTGLGLSLSHDIITKGHGGTLTVESNEGRGATFVLTLPIRNTVTPTRLL